MSYVYVKSQGEECYTTGFYKPDGTWVPEKDLHTPQEAALRVHWLHGGCTHMDPVLLLAAEALAKKVVSEDHQAGLPHSIELQHLQDAIKQVKIRGGEWA